MPILGPLLVGIGIGYAAVALYKILFTEQERKILESIFKTHHFEYGAATTLLGLLTKSPKAVGTGLYWMLDDLPDADKAILNLKQKWKNFCDKINQFLNQQNSGFNAANQLTYRPNYTTRNLSNDIDRLKIWLNNKKQEILQNIQNNSRLYYTQNYQWK